MADHRVPGMLHARLLAAVAGPDVARQRRALLARVAGRVLALGDGSGVDLVRHAAPDQVVVLDPGSPPRGRRTSKAARGAEAVEVVA
ncbi:MAG TPA: hypothetical protein VE152_11540, partial [Acidimicrobiales bacterium]|nr:hypothetical protein [Acidimicrobiales bacterium]